MSVSLKKNEKLSLTKNNAGLTKVFMGLGWDAAEGNFLQKLLGLEPEAIDLDASCLMFDKDKKLIDTVWFRQLKSKDNSVQHTGDNLTGDGDGDDEVITVDLTKLNSKVTTMVFVITSFGGQSFKKIQSANCRLVNMTDNQEIAKYTLSDMSDNTAQIMAKVYKENNEWIMQAIGHATDGRVQYLLIPEIEKFL